jgi:Carboxypeptidase regulatory-like domain
MIRQLIGYGTFLAAVYSGITPALAVQQQVQIQTTTQMPDMNGMQFLAPGRTAKTGTGRIRGRIVAADTGSVLRRAQVRISGPDIGMKTALTDAQGRYEFRDLPAGRFNVSVSKSGFVTMQYGQNRPFEPGRPIELVDAQVMEKADLALPRGSVLAGRIIDEFGEPVAEANVTAMRMQYTGGRRRLVPSGRNSMTNDLGQFRLYGLPPGEYFVSASLRTLDNMVMDILGANNGGPTGSNNNTGYAATYYPGTPNPAEAQRIAVGIGQELPSVDIQLQPVHLAKITGVATSSDGKPMSGALVMLMPAMKDAMQMFPGGTSRTNKDGQFTLNGIAPGEYTLQAQSLNAIMSAAGQAMALMSGGDGASSAPPPSAAEREFAMANVTVAGEDINGLVVVGTRGARASGRIVFDGGVAPEGMVQARLMAVPTDPDMNGPATAAFGNAAIKENNTFEIDGLVGGRTFRFTNPPKGWHVKRVLLDADDVTDKGIEFKPGEDVAGVTIEMTNKNQSISGSVTDARGGPSKDYTVVVFPQDQQKWTLTVNRYLQTARPDQSGQYKINNVPPGEYYAVAVEYVAQGDWNDPEWLTRASGNATRFTIQEGESKTLDLKLSR